MSQQYNSCPLSLLLTVFTPTFVQVWGYDDKQKCLWWLKARPSREVWRVFADLFGHSTIYTLAVVRSTGGYTLDGSSYPSWQVVSWGWCHLWQTLPVGIINSAEPTVQYYPLYTSWVPGLHYTTPEAYHFPSAPNLRTSPSHRSSVGGHFF